MDRMNCPCLRYTSCISSHAGTGEQLQTALRGSVLRSVRLPVAWERVVELGIAQRLDEPLVHRLHLEVSTTSPLCKQSALRN